MHSSPRAPRDDGGGVYESHPSASTIRIALHHVDFAAICGGRLRHGRVGDAFSLAAVPFIVHRILKGSLISLQRTKEIFDNA
jgi:hypothetical protein